MYTVELQRRVLILLMNNILVKTTKDPVVMHLALVGTLPVF